MSVINKMLQELDRRQGMSAPEGTLPPREVRAVPAARGEREWFWRIVAALMLASLGWVGWVAWQLQAPAPLATEQAIEAADRAHRAPPPPPVVQAVDKPAPPEILRLATAIETPIPDRPAAPESKPAPRPAAPPETPPPARPPSRGLDLDVPQARILPAPAPGAARVVKQDRAQTPADRAERDFRRAVALLNQGRGSDAEDALAAALAADASHEAARQTLVALQLESRRTDEARRLLQEGLAANPANAQFATVLARIHVERRDYPAALEAMKGASGSASADLHALRGTVLQRMGRHPEAVEAHQEALRIESARPQTWIGLGVSLEALQKRPEAAEAFRRALAAGPMSVELRDYAEQRVRALR
jgi:MSHA biogenesis protein MshN